MDDLGITEIEERGFCNNSGQLSGFSAIDRMTSFTSRANLEYNSQFNVCSDPLDLQIFFKIKQNQENHHKSEGRANAPRPKIHFVSHQVEIGQRDCE